MRLKILLLFIGPLLLSTIGYGQQQQKEKYRNKANDPGTGGPYDPNFKPPVIKYLFLGCDKIVKEIFLSSCMIKDLPLGTQVSVSDYDYKKRCFPLLARSVSGALVARCEYYPIAKALLNTADRNNIVPIGYDHKYDKEIDERKCGGY